MEITLAPERAIHLTAQIGLDVARDLVEQKKASLVAGTVGALLARPKPDEIKLLGAEYRLEPFWHVAISARTVYDRQRTFAIAVTGPEVQRVTLLNQELTVDPKSKGGPAVSIVGTEHCVQAVHVSQTFDGLSGGRVDLADRLAFPKTEIADLAGFSIKGVVIVPPQARASAVTRAVMAEVVKPVQQAQVIHEEKVEVTSLDLLFRPVYAFEYEWTAKGKKTIVEFDGLTGETTTGGKKLSDQVKGMLTRDLVFDVTADAVGMIVPGGSIAVKLVKAVVDRGARPAGQ